MGQLPVWKRCPTDRGATLIEYALVLSLIAAVCVVGISVLGNQASNELTDFHQSMDPEPTCDEWTRREVSGDEVGDGCSGFTSEVPPAPEHKETTVHKCDDGRTLYWNDAGWGYVGERMTLHPPGSAREAPEAERAACPA